MSETTPSGQPKAMQPGEFTPTVESRAVSFETAEVAPPSPLYIQRDDQMVWQMSSLFNGSHNITIRARLLLPTGKIVTIEQQRSFTATNGSTIVSIPLAEGFLLSVVVLDDQVANPGITFSRVAIARGAPSLANSAQMLIASYVSQQHAAVWPGGMIRNPQEGPGQVTNINVTSPAAGADWLFTVDTFQRLRLIAVQATLTTSGTVANRQAQLQVLNSGGAAIFTGPPVQNIPATTTALVVGSTVVHTAVVVATTVLVPIPEQCILEASMSIQSLTTALQAGDQWSAIKLYVEQWITAR